MNKHERVIVILLRIIGISGLFAIPAIFLPYSWMNATHEFLGLGELPNAPIVDYLTRSLSAFYAVVALHALLISADVRKYRAFVKLWAVFATCFGVVILGVDLHAGLPLSWTLSEGPPTILVGVLLLWLHRFIQEPAAAND